MNLNDEKGTDPTVEAFLGVNAWIRCAFSEHHPWTEAEIRGESGCETEHK